MGFLAPHRTQLMCSLSEMERGRSVPHGPQKLGARALKASLILTVFAPLSLAFSLSPSLCVAGHARAVSAVRGVARECSCAREK